MRKQLFSFSKQTFSVSLALMLILSACFICPLSSAQAVADEYAEFGLHKAAVIDFELSQTVTDYTAEGTEANFITQEIKQENSNQYLYLEEGNIDRNIRFDAYGDINTYSVDLKMVQPSAMSATMYTPTFVFYDETYKAANGTDINAISRLDFSYSKDKQE